MNLKNLKIEDANSVYVVIEIPQNSDPIKYEYDKEVGAIFVDRFMGTSMVYPCNYGFIPNTLSGDGDPVDMLVVSNYPVMSGAIINVKPIGVLITEDEKGQDEKILSVPTTKIDPAFENIKSYNDLPDIIIKKISHFFEHYKDLEKGKWVKVKGWEDQTTAVSLIEQGISRFNKSISNS